MWPAANEGSSVNACFADGSVRTIRDGTNDEDFCALESPNLGEITKQD